MKKAKNGASGIPVDASGGPTIDPTKNVLDLVWSAVQRIDDLRDAETRRVNELSAAESRRVDEQLSLRSEYEDKLRAAEAKRIDAIRAVDVNAVAVASERASAQASVLASQLMQSTEQGRALVASTAATQATQIQMTTAQLTDRISALEKSQYETKGKAGVSDPLGESRFAELTRAVDALAKKESLTTGRGEGADTLWKYIIAGVGLVLAILAWRGGGP